MSHGTDFAAVIPATKTREELVFAIQRYLADESAVNKRKAEIAVDVFAIHGLNPALACDNSKGKGLGCYLTPENADALAVFITKTMLGGAISGKRQDIGFGNTHYYSEGNTVFKKRYGLVIHTMTLKDFTESLDGYLTELSKELCDTVFFTFK